MSTQPVPEALLPSPGPLATDPLSTPVWTSRSQQRALAFCALLALVGIASLVLPLGIGILLGTLMAFAVEPFYRRLLRHWQRTQLAALAVVGSMTTIFAALLTWGGYLLVSRIIASFKDLKVFFTSDNQSLVVWSEKIAKWLPWLKLEPTQIVKTVNDWAQDTLSRASSILTTVAVSTIGVSTTAMHVLLSLFFLVLTMHFVLRHWHSLTHRAEILLPLHPRHSHALFEEFRKVGRSVLLGTILTGIAQGVLSGIGYWIAGVPDSLLYAAITAVASLVPVVGTVLIWVPIGIYLILAGHPYSALFLFIYGTGVVVLVSDYLIRPALVGRHGKVPALLMFIALFGGLEAFNVIGLILGPVIMSISVALLSLYERERTQRNSEVVPASPTT